jgi:hypothetical protein
MRGRTHVWAAPLVASALLLAVGCGSNESSRGDAARVTATNQVILGQGGTPPSAAPGHEGEGIEAPPDDGATNSHQPNAHVEDVALPGSTTTPFEILTVSDDYTVTSIQLTPPETFRLKNDACLGVRISKDRGCVFEVVFSPASAGEHNGRMKITALDSSVASTRSDVKALVGNATGRMGRTGG